MPSRDDNRICNRNRHLLNPYEHCFYRDLTTDYQKRMPLIHPRLADEETDSHTRDPLCLASFY